jgi:2-phosphosulfolactate phosphatase
MSIPIELVLTPAEITGQRGEHLNGCACVVFDVLRATSTIAVALSHGAARVTVVAEIEDALRCRDLDPGVLLAGERLGKRISAELTGSIAFDLGNSPREFVPDRVRDRSIVMTTTNGTRAIRACHGATHILAGAFLNLAATARALQEQAVDRVRIVLAGTGDQIAFEDLLGAGALLSMLGADRFKPMGDACLIARELYERHRNDLEAAFARSINGARLLSIPDLAPDVPFCAQTDTVNQPVYVENHIARLRAP